MLKKITQESVRKKLTYDEHTGRFVRSIVDKRKTRKPREYAGSLTPRGYRKIVINGVTLLEHRLVWFYLYGYFPENEIDHINNIKDDNRPQNLREATRSCNIKNSSMFKNNSSGVTGVSFCNTFKKWRAYANNDGKTVQLGQYKKLKDAVLARYKAEVSYGYLSCKENSSAYLWLIRNGMIDV